MTIQEAKRNIGKPFKIIGFTGLSGMFDTILSVDQNGTIEGNFIIAHCEDCRFKNEQPEQLKKYHDDQSNSNGSLDSFGG